jgi:DNA-binding LacI/PurR family transcriptional regulator
MNKITMSDIAKKAGISRKYVSGILNNKEDIWVSDETRQKVLDIVKELNYRPNFLATSLKTGKTNTIGITSGSGIPIKGMFTDAYFSELFAGIGDTASEKGLRLVIQQNSEMLAPEGPMAMAEAGMTDGIIFILLSEYLDDFYKVQLPRLSELGKPVVVVHALRRYYECPAVGMDSFDAARRATLHLIEHGYEEIGLATFAKSNPFDEEVEAGYRRALMENRIQIHPQWIMGVMQTNAKGGYQLIDAMLKEGKKIPRAIFTGRTELAQGIKIRLAEEGLKVPEDCALCAYGALHNPGDITNTITVLRHPNFEKGQKAAEILWGLMQGKEPEGGINTLLRAEMVVNTSCGCEKRLMNND